jgi:hypothetical protein
LSKSVSIHVSHCPLWGRIMFVPLIQLHIRLSFVHISIPTIFPNFHFKDIPVGQSLPKFHEDLAGTGPNRPSYMKKRDSHESFTDNHISNIQTLCLFHIFTYTLNY